MGIFTKNKNYGAVAAVVIIAVLAAAGIYIYVKNPSLLKLPLTPAAKPKEAVEWGVVDYEKLVVEHPDYQRLQKLDQEIYMLEGPKVDPGTIKKLHGDLSSKMENYKKQVEILLKKERDQIQADSQAKVKAIQNQLSGKFRQKQEEFQKYRDAMEKEYVKASKDPNRPLSPYEKEFHRRLQKQSGDLIALKERQIVAKTLELSKKTQGRLLSLKNQLNRELADYEDTVREEHQNEKLNLQLKMQVAKDDEEREGIQKQLSIIYEDEKTRTDARRKELAAKFGEAEKEESSKNKAQLDAYRAKLDKDVNRQLASVQQKVAMEMMKSGISQGNTDPSIPKDIQDKLEARRQQLMREMKALEDSLKPQIQAIEAEAAARFEKKKTELVKKLQDYQKSLSGEFEQKKNQIIGELQIAGMETIKTRKKMMEQRENLYKEIISDINKEVEKIAKSENINFVAGEYLVNLEGKDLNSQAIDAVRNIRKDQK